LLVQLPPDQERDDDRLDYFLRGLPEWMRVAVELRHHSWAVDPVFDLLSRHHATYVVMSGAGLPCVLRATSTTVYVRLHGPDHDHHYARWPSVTRMTVTPQDVASASTPSPMLVIRCRNRAANRNCSTTSS
jgi:uncharacterized protein YecE (DUF72 family)